MSLPFQHVLITGGAGFVGSNLAIHLKQRYDGLRITCLDNLKRRGSEFNLARLSRAGIPFVHGDIRCNEDLEISGIDLLLECSAEPSVLAGYQTPRYTIQTNLNGAVNCLELCRRLGAAFFFISSSRIYPIDKLLRIGLEEEATRFVPATRQLLTGISSRGITEEFPLDGHRSLYGASKFSVELLAAEYHAAFNLPYVINRCGILTGPWQMAKADQGLIALWLIRHHFRRPLDYIGYGGLGKQVRDFLDIDDYCDLLCLQLESFARFNGLTFNVGGGPERSVSLLELTELARSTTGNTVDIRAVAEIRPGDIPYYVTDIAKIRALSGWTPSRSPQDTFRKIARWIQDNEEHLRQLL